MATSTLLSQKLIDYLPAIHQEDAFLGQFLSAFEKILIGRSDNVAFPEIPGLEEETWAGLEETIDKLAVHFVPRDPGSGQDQAPEEFLSWLSGWVALILRADLDAEKQRSFMANIVQFYRQRGTKENLKNLIAILTVGVPDVAEPCRSEFQIDGERLQIGVNTYLGGGAPHFFRVTISLPRAAPAVQKRQMAIARALIELEKPAHTFFELAANFPTMQIGKYSRVGVDTLLGTGTDT